jgi:hypothetical protein
MKATHKEYVISNRKKIGDIATGMINGSVNYLEGAIELASLRFEVDLPEDDKDLIAFTGVASEIDHLPIGSVRKHWSKKSLERHEPEILSTTKWAKEVTLPECKSLAKRFNTE